MTPFTEARESHYVPARTGKGFAVGRGELIRLPDLQGAQPVNFWAFCRDDPLEFLSCEHTKPTIEKLIPRAGDNIVLRAEMDAIIVVSACPQDLNPTCGGAATDIFIEVGR